MSVRAPRPGAGFVRIGAGVALALYACAVWGNGLDRLSTTMPTLERLVPGPFRAQADRSAAVIALARSDTAQALARANEAVLHDPLDPLSNSLLGSARAYNGDPQGADDAFRIAATRGWRDRLTQLYWYGTAVQTGDAERAALRADALLRTDPDFIASGKLLAPLETSPAGQQALAARLAENPVWARAYLTASGDAEKLRLRSAIVLLAAQQGGALDCSTPLPLVKALLNQGMRRDAEHLWTKACGDKTLAGVPEGGLVDGGFQQLARGDAKEASPFGWQSFASGDVAIEPVVAGSGTVTLTLGNSAAVSKLVLQQSLALAPGAYRVRVTGAQAARGRIAFSLDCSSARRPADIVGDPAGDGQELTIGACDQQALGLWLRPGTAPVTLTGITLEKR